MELFVDRDPFGLAQEESHCYAGFDARFAQVFRFHNRIILTDASDGWSELLDPLLLFAKERGSFVGFKMGAEDLERGGGEVIGIKMGPLGSFDRVFADELFSAEEEGDELLIDVGEFKPFAEFELLLKSGMGKEGQERGDDGDIKGVVFDRGKPVLNFGEGNLCERGKDGAKEAEFVELDEHGAQFAEGVSFGELLPDPLDGDGGKELIGMRADSCFRGALNVKAEAASEADSADHPEPVFFDPLMGIADGADDFGFEIDAAVDIIEDLFSEGVVEHPIDGEVAAVGIFSGCGEFNAGGSAAVMIVEIASKGGDFILVPVDDDDEDPKGNADGDGMGKEGLDGLGRGVGRDVDVVGRVVQKQVTDPAPCIVGDKACFREGLDDESGLRMLFHQKTTIVEKV